MRSRRVSGTTVGKDFAMFYFDPLYLVFMIPGLLLMLWAQSKVRSNYARFSRVPNHLGMTGAQAARRVLDANGLYDVAIEGVPGELSDHYDPRKRVLRLSQPIYSQPSIAAIAVAAHEAGHAIQHAKAYAPLQLRTAIVPAVSIGSNLGFFVLIAGILLASQPVAWLGVVLFGLSTLFALITLPVEFDASARAKANLLQLGIVDGGVGGGSEAKGVEKMLGAAAWTYVAGFAASVLTLLYYVMLVSGMRRSD
jgi:Zn-dependent membrane protease YugP